MLRERFSDWPAIEGIADGLRWREGCKNATIVIADPDGKWYSFGKGVIEPKCVVGTLQLEGVKWDGHLDVDRSEISQLVEDLLDNADEPFRHE